jgi:hypothetical protein
MCCFHILRDVEIQICLKNFPGQYFLRQEPWYALLAYDHLKLLWHSAYTAAFFQVGQVHIALATDFGIVNMMMVL